MQRAGPLNVKLYLRSLVGMAMIVLWSVAGLTGLLLWLAPTGQRSGRIPLLFGLTKSSWGDFHFWFSILAGLVAVLHLTIDWKALRACVRYLVTTHRGASPQP